MTINEASLMVMANIDDDEAKLPQISPLLIAIIARVIAAIIVKYGGLLLEKLFKDHPLNLCEKAVLRRIIRKSCLTPTDFRKHGQTISRALVTTFPQFTPEQIQAMIQEVR